MKNNYRIILLLLAFVLSACSSQNADRAGTEAADASVETTLDVKSEPAATETDGEKSAAESTEDALLPSEETPAVEQTTAWTTKSIDFGVQYVRTDSTNYDGGKPKTVWITSEEELRDYYDQHFKSRRITETGEIVELTNTESDQVKYNLDYEYGLSFSNAVEIYDSEFFRDHDLLFVITEESSGSFRHKVTEVNVIRSGDDEKGYTLCPVIKHIAPDEFTCDMAAWHIIIEVDKEYGKEHSKDILPDISETPEFVNASAYLTRYSFDALKYLMDDYRRYEGSTNIAVSYPALLKQISEEQGEDKLKEILHSNGLEDDQIVKVMEKLDEIMLPIVSDDPAGHNGEVSSIDPVLVAEKGPSVSASGKKEYTAEFKAGWGRLFHHSPEGDSNREYEDYKALESFKGKKNEKQLPECLYAMEVPLTFNYSWNTVSVDYTRDYTFVIVSMDLGYNHIPGSVYSDYSPETILWEIKQWHTALPREYSLIKENVLASIPAFSIDCTADLTGYLNGKAGEVLQNLKFSVNDAGTEKAGEQEIEKLGIKMSSEPHTDCWNFNRPFLYFVVHKETGVPVICGYVGDLE